VQISAAAAGAVVVDSAGDAGGECPAAGGKRCVATGAQPLDATSVHEKRRVKGDPD